MDGISFIVRARNEEKTLETCLRSLQGLTIPHEIIVILHCTTDNSHAIVKKIIDDTGMPIYVFHYDVRLSRAGYENLATDMTSKHSMCEYSRWSFSKSNYLWKFRWDADFVASDALIRKLNSRSWKAPTKTSCIRIPAVSNEGHANEELYLFAGEYEYRKYIFWEYTEFIGEQFRETWVETIRHTSSLTDKKLYWTEPSWFLEEDSEEARVVRNRYAMISAICGPEINGQARASNPASDPHFFCVQKSEDILSRHDIHFLR